MIHLDVSFRAGRKRQGRAAYCVDTRSVIPGGKEKFFATKDEAKQYVKRLGKELVKDDTDAWKWTFADLHEAFIANDKKSLQDGEINHSYLNNSTRMCKVFVNLRLNGKLVSQQPVWSLTTGQIALQLVDQLKENRSKKTVELYLGTIRRMLDFSVTYGCRETNPMSGVKAKGDPAKPKKTINPANIQPHVVEKIMGAMNPTWQLIAYFAANIGLRQGELRALTWDCILWDRNKVDIHKAYKHKSLNVGAPKTAKGMRKVPLPIGLKKAMQEHYIAMGRPDGENLVFPHQKKTAKFLNGRSNSNVCLNNHQFLNAVHDACDAAGVEWITWKDLRHFNASVLLKKHSNDMWEVSRRLGHAQVATTQNVYGHFIEDLEDNEEDDLLSLG